MAKKKDTKTETEIIDSENGCDCETVEINEETIGPEEAAALKAEVLKMTDYAQRVTADMENMKKRNKNIASEMYGEGKKDTLLKLLPVLDNFDRALEVEMDESVKTGFQNIRKMFIDILDKMGVREIDCIGKELDPNYHNVLMQTDDEENAGKITNVFEKGYTIGDKVLRHASVVVAK